ncbi:hypothetical protein [Aliiroseovarius sp. 2305UL8-7]|uniref:hypothetical protein n=1 Tax=Aliiroseovarius conchicola TaxID=3121637 RepID=UPI0035299FCC
MKQIAKIATIVVVSTVGWSGSAFSEDQQPPNNPELSEGAELLSQGFKLLLEGLANEVEPMADQWAEGWAGLVERFGDLNAYHPPETLPNGDIIIRRRTPLDAAEAPEGETEL